MGDYVNPTNESKEDFLEREAIEISREEFLESSWNFSNKVGLCLVKNARFSACVVAYNREDAEHYADSTTDSRPKKYFLIELSKLEGALS